jgi:Cys-tRNA(Pro) deacylase
MGKERIHVTPAMRMLKERKVPFVERPYKYIDRGGTSAFSQQYLVDEHKVIKTLVMEDEHGAPLIILMHGDLEVSTKELARSVGVKRLEPCSPERANKHTGYMVGGISPFGTRKAVRVYIESTILDLPEIFINGGRRGLLVALNPKDAARILNATPVTVGIKG